MNGPLSLTLGMAVICKTCLLKEIYKEACYEPFHVTNNCFDVTNKWLVQIW